MRWVGLVAVAEVDLPAVGQVARGGHGRQRLTVSAPGGDVSQDASGFGGQDRVVLLQTLEVGDGGGQVLKPPRCSPGPFSGWSPCGSPA